MATKAPAFSVKVEGMDTLRQRLKTGYLFGPVRGLLIENAAKAAEKTMRRAAKGRAGKGVLSRAVQIEFGHHGLVAYVGFFGAGHGIVSSYANIARTVNYGRRPGRRPPYKAIKRWADRAGIPTKIRDLQEQIKVRGTKGLHFMEAGEQAANTVIKTGIRKTEAEIKALWKRP